MALFSTFYNDGKQYINFLDIEDGKQYINFLDIELKQAEKISEHTLYDAYKQHKSVVEIEAIRGRRKNKRL